MPICDCALSLALAHLEYQSAQDLHQVVQRELRAAQSFCHLSTRFDTHKTVKPVDTLLPDRHSMNMVAQPDLCQMTQVHAFILRRGGL